MQARVGEVLEIPLEGNPTTGFLWELASPSEPGFVKVADEWDVKGGQAGAPAVQRFRFRALTSGKYRLTFVHRRPWENKEPREQRVVEVNVI
jgi:inhibitor of cysteine peptidase